MKSSYPIYQEGNSLYLSREDTHHLFHVLRAEDGEAMMAYFENKKYAVITKSRPSPHLEIVQDLGEISLPFPNLTLHFALLKSGNDELVIEKGTELGAYQFAPFISERTVIRIRETKDKEKKVNKFFLRAKEAAMQCGSNYLPSILPISSFEDSLSSAKGTILFFDEKEASSPSCYHELFQKIHGNLDLFIGPEGGYSEKERDFAKKNNAIFLPLSRRILRAETASISAIAILNFLKEEGIWH